MAGGLTYCRGEYGRAGQCGGDGDGDGDDDGDGERKRRKI
jgi:hypothetical protein